MPALVPAQPYYCEENAWHEAKRVVEAGEPGPIEVVFISNPARQCALWAQRAAPKPGEPVVWDYHVVVRVGGDILDPDCTAGARLPAAAWLAASFPHGEEIFSRYLPRFRRYPAGQFLMVFASDRRHMRRPDGTHLKPPPAWPPIVARDGSVHTLPAFLDFDTVGPTPWVGLRAFAAALATPGTD